MWSRLVPRLIPLLHWKNILSIRRLSNLSLSDVRVQKYIESFDSSKASPELGSLVNLIQTKQAELKELEMIYIGIC